MFRIPSVLLLLLFSQSCAWRPESLGPAEYRAATSAVQTVKVVSDDPALAQSLPDHKRVLDSAVNVANAALQVKDAKPEMIGEPLVTSAELAVDPSQAAIQAETNEKIIIQEVIKEQSETWVSKLLKWSGWAAVAGGALALARALGIPGTQFLSNPLIKAVAGKALKALESKAAEAEGKVQVLTSTVEGSMVGRYGLQVLDSVIGDSAVEKIRAVTRGKESTVEGLFKFLSRNYVVDSSSHRAPEVEKVIDEIKDRMPTHEGVPSCLAGMIGV